MSRARPTPASAPYAGVLDSTPDVLLQPAALGYTSMQQQAPPSQQQQQMQQQRAHSLSQHHSMDSIRTSASASPPAPVGPASLQQGDSPPAHQFGPTLVAPPALEAFLTQGGFAAQFKQQLNQIDQQDFKTGKHQLPLAKIKRIMKSDEDVRMISAEAPILFAKACELFILDLSLRGWAWTERGGPPGGQKRRTLQRNDVASAIQSSELFDFLYPILPLAPYNPEEEGTPPHDGQAHMDDDTPRYSRTPDVLLERPLPDPYGDAIPHHAGGHQHQPQQHHQHQHHATSSTRSHQPRGAAAHAPSNGGYSRSAAATAAAQQASLAASAAAAAAASTSMTDDSPLSLLASPSHSNPDSYGMTSMSRGVSMDPNGAPISTPVFSAGLPLDLMPDTPSGTNAGAIHIGGGGMTNNLLTPGGLVGAPATPSAFFGSSSTMIPQTPMTGLHSGVHGGGGAFAPETPGGTWMEGPGSPNPASTPSATSMSVDTPSFQSGYSAEGSVEETTEE